jgi:hypothetical protein
MPRWDDEIITACTWRDCIYIFCRSGEVYRMVHDEITGIVFELVGKMFK